MHNIRSQHDYHKMFVTTVAQKTLSTLFFTAVTQNHGDDRTESTCATLVSNSHRDLSMIRGKSSMIPRQSIFTAIVIVTIIRYTQQTFQRTHAIVTQQATFITPRLLAHLSKSNSKTFQGLSRTIRRIYKEN